MKSATNIVSRSDALYGGIAMGVTILELALIATNPKLGSFSLEFSLITQLLISLVIEFYVGHSFANRFGTAYTTIYGFIFKFACAIFLTTGFYLALLDYWHISWCLILISFTFDSIGTGCLRSSFRPAYNDLHLHLTGHSADYVGAFKKYLHIRIGTPLTLLLIASLMMSSGYYLYAMLVTMLPILLCRVIQTYVSYHDLKPVLTKKNSSKHRTRLYYIQHFAVISKYPSQFLGYVAGNTLEMLILMYAIGLLYRHKPSTDIPEGLSWLGSSLTAFVVFLASTVLGVVGLSQPTLKKSGSTFSFFCFFITVAISLPTAIDNTNTSYFLILSAFCFFGAGIGIIMTRVTSNEVLDRACRQEIFSFFLITELVTTIAVIFTVMVSSLFFSPEKIMNGLSYGLIMLMGAYCFSTTYKQLKEK